jgi:hypothetical protein
MKKMTVKEALRTETLTVEKTAALSSPFTLAMIAALVAIVGSGLTWYSSRESTRQAMIISCIARLDAQEIKIREHAEPFFAAVGTMAGKTADPTHSRAIFLEAATPILTHAYGLTAYVPPDVAFAALNFSNVVRENMHAATTQEQEKIMAASQDRVSGILYKYDEFMKKFQKQKSECLN